ncbi:unnamed protein product [Clavelina lepadiformis]|uniref:Uncharacterized protein n=1 Tax=Clavelina lepadiformis TaxID=159417 RepID=A0ABP0G9H1_CLALP
MKKAIEKVRQVQLERREDDIRLQAGIKVSAADIPVVHPNYSEVSFFEGGAVPEHETYAPSTEKPKGMNHNRNVSFDNLLKSSERFSAIVGYPGSGKTTLSKRLAKTQEYFCLYFRFMDLPDGEKLNLRTLLIDDNFPELDDATCEYVWEWVKKNQKKCLLLFDGMDQADWSFNKNAPKVSYDTPQSVQDLIANLCCKHFLRQVKLIFTSRPHSVIALPESLRPDATILLGDLPYESMKKLFYAYSGESADKLWKDISESAPVVFSLCFNPLLLQLVIAASLNPSKSVGEINTTTRVFSTVLENLRCSNHAKHQDITLLMGQLSEVAYKATMRSSVVITRDDLKTVGLKPDEIQDIVVGIYAHFTATSRVFDGHVKYFFAHQLYQEFFTAKHMISNLSLIEFKGLVDNQLFSSEKWSVIRRFICGLLVDLMKAFIDPSINQITATTYSQTENVAEKRRIWIEALKSQLVRFEKLQYGDWRKDNNIRRYISLLCELNESSDMELFNMASLRFPTEMSLFPLKLSSSEAAIFCDVLSKQQKELKKLHLSSCFSPGDVERLISAISEMPGKVKELYIGGNIIKDIPGPEFFVKIEEDLCMIGCFEDGRIVANSSEKQKIQLALDQLHGSELKVYFGDVTLHPRGDVCNIPDLFTNDKSVPPKVFGKEVSVNKLGRSDASDSFDEPLEYIPVQTTAIIGSSGGRVEFDGCVIEVPEGAMKENMFFVFTLIYDDEEENIDKMKLTPTLKCSPSYNFEKPVTITLPTCYLPDKSDVLVTPRTHDGKDWSPLGNVPHHDKYSLSFETMSFCRKDFVGNRGDFSSKRLLFKCSMVHKNSRNPHINWWILSYMGQNTAENRGQRCFICEVRSDQNLILKLKSDNIVFDHRESVIDSSELFRRPTKVRRQFSIRRADYSMILEEDSSFDFEIVAENTGIKLHEGNISLASLSATETTASPDECDFNGNQVTVDSASQDAYEHHLDKNNIYKVVQKPKAHVLFLSNTRFPTWPTEADLRQIEPTLDLLRQLFQGLGCEVNVRPNLKAGEMRQTITNFSRDDQHTDFCVLFIISHGGHISGQDVVYGTDGDYLTISEVVNNFTPNNPSLLEKPKLLFFHCCRGGVIDIGVRPATLPTPPHSDLEQEIERLLEEYERHHPDNSNNIPRSLHIATVQSTLEGYVSSFGRFFFAVVNVFSRNAKDDHFLDLMTKVTRAMGRRTPQLSRQLPVVVSHLDKSLYFFPGCDY